MQLADVPLWFLLALFWVSLIVYILEKYVNKTWVKISLFILVVGVGHLLSIFNINLPFFLSQALVSSIFYEIGHLLYKNNIVDQINNLWFGGFLFIGLIIGIFFDVHTDISDLNINVNYILFFLPAICGSLLVIALSKYLESYKGVTFLAYVGRYSLMIMCIHLPLYYLSFTPLFYLYHHILGIKNITFEQLVPNMAYGLFRTIIFGSLSLLFGIYLKKWLPFIFGKNNQIVYRI